MSDTYYTIESVGEAKVTEKMSRFLAFAHHADSEEAARAVIADYTRRYHDARHVCWAYSVGDRALSSDNGEPSGTAGKPIAGQITSLGLRDVVVVVVRYFGGIKLGTSGLIVCYRQAAREALEAGGRIECHEQAELKFTYSCMEMHRVMQEVKRTDAVIADQEYDNLCTMRLTIRRDHADALRTNLADIPSVTFN